MVLAMNNFAQTVADLNLTGTWKINENTYETWHKQGDSLVGYQYELNYGVKEIKEHLTIKQENNQLVYIAKVVDQNNALPISFTLNRTISNRFQFENFNHDFPNIISYRPMNDSTFLVSVKGKNQQGFDITLRKVGEPKSIPVWFMKHLESEVGVWIADNTEYFSDSEPYMKYGITWRFGVDKTSVIGELYGITADGNKELFWQLRQYWNNEKQQAAFHQYGKGGMVGKGFLTRTEDNTFEIIQAFSIPNGYTWIEKHVNILTKKQMLSTAFNQTKNDQWNKKRTMAWKKQ